LPFALADLLPGLVQERQLDFSSDNQAAPSGICPPGLNGDRCR
jgi:hypothetical protein